jgi:hypothetical protein
MPAQRLQGSDHADHPDLRAGLYEHLDAGVALIPVSFGRTVAHRLRAYDIANKAVAGVSAPFDVVGSG